MPKIQARCSVLASEVAIRCDNLSVDYNADSGTVRALTNITLNLRERRFTVIAGPSGSGKSTLLRVLAGVQSPTTGTVKVGGNELSAMTRRQRRNYRRYGISIVLQDPSDNLFHYLTALEHVELAARLRDADPADSMAALTEVGLANAASRRPAQLSGGEQQRLAFAIASIGQPAVILADEPTAELDRRSANELITIMRNLVAAGSTVVATSHDHTVIDAADDIITIHDGRYIDPLTTETDRSIT
jgi:putative ABC transport system ATP-binding protein